MIVPSTTTPGTAAATTCARSTVEPVVGLEAEPRLPGLEAAPGEVEVGDAPGDEVRRDVNVVVDRAANEGAARARWASGDGRPGVTAVLLGVLRMVIPAEEGVRPGAGAGEGVVLHDDRPVEHLLLLAVGLQSLVGLRPDAFGVVDLAEPVARPTAGAVALVLRAHRLGAHVGDLGE